MVIGQAEEDDDVVEVLDQQVRELVRREGVDPQRDAAAGAPHRRGRGPRATTSAA